MEERIIDDEYGRGVRLKKTKDGYVDVTDELAQNAEQTEYEETDEVAFEFPVLEVDEDDEDLVGLSPEEALALKKRKEEEAAQRKADYEKACEEGDKLLALGSFKAAEIEFEKALSLDEEAMEASVGYWRAKTADFTNPDVLIEEYANAGIESLEYDLGSRAVDKIKADYQAVFKERLTQLEEEEKPLAKEVEEKQASRRKIISARLKRSTVAFCAAAIPMLALLTLTIIIGLKNFTTLDDTYLLPTILLAAAFLISFIVFMVLTNKWINDFRIRRANERLKSTEEGKKLVRIRDFKELYACLLLDEEKKED